MPRNPRRSSPSGLLPLPTQALERLEAQLDPKAECVTTHPNLVRRKVGQDEPWLILFNVPDRQQDATAFCGGSAEGGAAPDPRSIRTGNEGSRGKAATAIDAESDVFRIPHVGMPAPRSWPGAGSEPGSISTVSDWPGPGRTAPPGSFPWGPPEPGPASVPLSGPSRPRAGWPAGCARPRESRNSGGPR